MLGNAAHSAPAGMMQEHHGLWCCCRLRGACSLNLCCNETTILKGLWRFGTASKLSTVGRDVQNPFKSRKDKNALNMFKIIPARIINVN